MTVLALEPKLWNYCNMLLADGPMYISYVVRNQIEANELEPVVTANIHRTISHRNANPKITFGGQFRR